MSAENSAAKSDNKNNSGTYQHVSDVIGTWGPLQLHVCLVLLVFYTPGPFNNLGIIFYTTDSQFWCSTNNTLENLDTSFQCKTRYSNETCHEWTFNDTRKTITNEWNLVCDRRWLISLSVSCYQIGFMFSGPIFGLFSDHYGRKMALLLSITCELISTIFCVASFNVYHFAVARFFMGFAGLARYQSAVLLIAEVVGPKVRAKMIAAYDIWYFIIRLGSITAAYYIENFRIYYTIAICLEIIVIFSTSRLPESPLWQLINDKYEPAKETILKYSKKSKEDKAQLIMKLDSLYSFLTTRKNDELHSKKPSMFKILKRWMLFKLVVIICFIWFVAAYVNYGTAYVLRDLTGNIYINSYMMCIADILSNVLLYFYVEKMKRRTILCLCQLATGIIFICLTGFVGSKEHLIFQSVFIMIGKFFSGVIFVMVYIYTPEVFPTSVRQFSVGLCSFTCRIASISSAFIPELVQATNIEFAFFIFGGVALIGAGLSLFLFETKGKELPNTVEEMIDLQKRVQD